jgi:hypothetical protein
MTDTQLSVSVKKLAISFELTEFSFYANSAFLAQADCSKLTDKFQYFTNRV